MNAESKGPEFLRPKAKLRIDQIAPKYESAVKRMKMLAKMMQDDDGGAANHLLMEQQRVLVFDAVSDFLSIRTEEEIRMETIEFLTAGKAGWGKER
jgi:hypothetical protein